MPHTFHVGNALIHSLSDGVCLMDGGAVYGIIPKPLWVRVAPSDEVNRVRMGLNCLLIESQGKRILVETGFGPKLPLKQRDIFGIPRSLLTDDLAELGVRPGDIDIVINSHLHGDHAGGNTSLVDGQLSPTFPYAGYVFQEREWADAIAPNERTSGLYLPENLFAIQQRGQLRLISGDQWLTDEVQCIVTPGHTRAHQSVLVRSQGETAIFVGDVAPTVTHLERIGWATAFDAEPMVTLETKRALISRALEASALLFLSHDPNIRAGRLERLEKGVRVVPAYQ